MVEDLSHRPDGLCEAPETNTPLSVTGHKGTADFWAGLHAIKAFLAKIDANVPARRMAMVSEGMKALEAPLQHLMCDDGSPLWLQIHYLFET